MKKSWMKLLTLLALVIWANPSPADDVVMPEQAVCGACCYEACQGNWLFDFEATFLRFHMEGGVVDHDGDDGEFGFDFAPRFELGYAFCDGLGARVRYWSYDHDTRSTDGDLIVVETYHVDFEVFDRIDLSCATHVEFSGGVRYLEFDGDFSDGAVSRFDGMGLTMGLNVKRQALGGQLYGKARGAIVMGDIEETHGGPDIGLDHTATQIELGVGYEIARCLSNGAILRLRAGIEVQQWLGLVPKDDVSNNFSNDDVTVDVGFGGFVLGAGLDY